MRMVGRANYRPGVDAGWPVLFAFQCPLPRATHARRWAGEKLDGFVLRAADANRQPTSELIETLENSEKYAVDYHRPQRLGEVFFNDWD
jgi:hypothetical protein